MKMSVGELKRLVREAAESEGDGDGDLNTLEVGDMVDVDNDLIGTVPVRILGFVDDVRKAVGMPDDEHVHPGDELFKGPGFEGEIDPSSGESGKLVFSLDQVMPGSKAKYYFPKLGDEYEEDEFGRPAQNPYRDAGRRFAVKARSRSGDYAPPGFEEVASRDGKQLDEARRGAPVVDKPMSLHQLRAYNTVAFRGYVDMFVENCTDEFHVDDQGNLWVESKDPRTGNWSTLKWHGDDLAANTGPGSGWQAGFSS